ncbi:hypothetical protein VTN77DRAFT_8775 [Rasamsonia byssochlamydoides]|uniref:uncharacterized protein n=1 Tax=Rasamsonia byssochlamydoides TaxID=89139 RepID=UPI0037443AB0
MKWEAIALLSAIAPAVLADNSTFEASTSNGLIIGHRSSKSPDVIEYLGIPYAQPPVGELRFAPPQKYEGQGVYVASDYGLYAQVANLLDSRI